MFRISEIFRCLAAPVGLLRLGFGLSGLFGGSGGGNSTSSSSTTSNTTNNATDRRLVVDGGSILATEGANITTSDIGAVQRAADLGQAAILGATQVATSTNAQAGQILVKALDVTSGAVAELSKAYETANSNAQGIASGNKTLMIAGGVAALLYALSNMGKLKK